MATPMEEEVQGSSPAAAAEAEGGSPDKPVVELPAPEGWKKKLIPKKRRDEIVYITPTGEEIKSRAQLDRYLKSHPGGPPSSEFHWGTGTTPRRSSRLTEKMQTDAQTPESESKKTPKRSRKSDAGSEDTKRATKRRKSGDVSAENEDDKEVDKDESMEEDKLEETSIDDKSGKEEDVKPEEQEMKKDEKVEGLKAEDVEMQETVETGEDKAVEVIEQVPVEEDKAVMEEPEVYPEEVKVSKETEVGEDQPSKEDEVEEEKQGKEPEVEEEKPSKEPEVHLEEKSEKGPEVHLEEKSEKEPEVQLEEKSDKEPEVQVAEYSAANDHEVKMQEEAIKNVAEEEKSDNKGTYGNGVDTEPKVPTYAEPQEPLDVKNENGHSGIVLQGDSEQQKSVEPMKEMNDDSKAKYATSDAPRTEELQSSHSSAPQLGTSS